jgi:hypothetical protein
MPSENTCNSSKVKRAWLTSRTLPLSLTACQALHETAESKEWYPFNNKQASACPSGPKDNGIQAPYDCNNHCAYPSVLAIFQTHELITV